MIRKLLFVCLGFFIHWSAQAQTINGVLEQDYNALVAFYNALDGPNWSSNNFWLSSEPVTNWHGVTVDGDRVTGLYLWEDGMVGSIPSDVGDLTALRELTLTSRGITGDLPDELFNLTSIEVLSFYGFSINKSLSPLIGNLVNLQRLELNDCSLTGPIPTEIENLDNLTSLYLENNSLSGEIPVEIGNLNSLNNLSLAYNSFTGSIPSSLSNLNLVTLNLSGFDMQGQIPSVIYDLVNLYLLNLSDCNLSGEVPAELFNLPTLEDITLANNSFTSFPGLVSCSPCAVRGLNIRENEISGSFPDAIFEFTQLLNLYLSGNNLNGEVPIKLGTLTSLENLNISNNSFEGKVPDEVLSLTELRYLDLSYTKLNYCPNLSTLSNFIEIRLNNAQFDFATLEWVYALNPSTYMYQEPLGIGQSIMGVLGEDLTIEHKNVGGTQNRYRWSDGGDFVEAESETISYAIEDLEESETGTYTLQVVNDAVPVVSLRYKPINIFLDIPGRYCETSLDLTDGIYSVKENLTWFKFEPSQESVISITGPSGPGIGLALYNDCMNSSFGHIYDVGLGIEYSKTVSPGEPLYLNWNFLDGNEFEFVVSIEAPEPGRTCDTAIEINEGIQTDSEPNKWYIFRSPGGYYGDATITSTGLTNVDTEVEIKYDCEYPIKGYNDQYDGDQSKLRIHLMDKVYIRWKNKGSSELFDWSLTPTEEHCGPITSDGTYTANDANCYYIYTATKDEKVKISTVGLTDVDTYISTTTHWESNDNINGLQQSSITVPLRNGEKVVFYFGRPAIMPEFYSHDWSLSVGELQQGDFCDNYLTPSPGVNSAPYAPVWYAYTATNEELMRIYSVGYTDEDTKILLSNACPSRGGSLNDDYYFTSKQSAISRVLQPGQTIYFKWLAEHSDQPFDWYFESAETEEGEVCEKAEKIDLGVQLYSEKLWLQWYEFVAPHSGNFTFSSVGQTNDDTDLFVLSEGCGYIGTGEYSTDVSETIKQSEITMSLNSGQQIFLAWRNRDLNEFQWSATLETCEVLYKDDDGDGYGDANLPIESCEDVADYVSNSNDCNDQDANITDGITWYADADGDGFGDENATQSSCTQPEGYVDNSTDCDDTDKDVYPGAPAKADGKDNDCDGTVDKLGQTISFDPISDKQEGDSFDLEATSDSDLEINYAVSGPAELDGNTLTVTGPGRVTVTATQEGSDGFKGADEVVQTFCVNPIPSISVEDDEFNVLTLSSNYESGNQWSKDGEVIEGASDQSYTVTAAGAYTVKVTFDDCSGISDEFVATVTSVDDLTGMTLAMYPNPFSDDLRIQILDNPESETTIIMMDMQGKIWLQRNEENSPGYLTISTSQLPSGMYFVVTKSGDAVIKQKVVKE